MSRFRSLLEWAIIIVPLVIVVILGYHFLFSAPAAVPSGLPGNGGFFQVPLDAPQVYTKQSGTWQFTLTANHAYTLAGKVVGRHEYPPALPDGIIALDLAVANGDLLINDNLHYFTFRMGDRTLEYSYDVPAYAGLTEAYIDEHISNSHLVFLDPALEAQVKSAKPGDCIILKGKLVDIEGSSTGLRYRAHTSTVRTDQYPEGCEVILVESFQPVSCGT
ncbi:MAG: hypothetical protein GYA23_08700 [Methanomicrobiales archaeon]|nr:hypothetical protein [Methanomicrobiales archaeon]